jgi:uncharacterized membrane protein YraQ (UPF0718 family)
MDLASLVFSVILLLAMLGIALSTKGASGIREGVAKSADLFLRSAPQMALGFLIGGTLGILLPEKQTVAWLGADSGAKGLWVGTLAGALTPGGPFAHFPILASLSQKGAGIGPLAAYIAAWSLLGIHRVVLWEAPFLGWRFALARWGACLLFPPLLGWLANTLFVALGSRPPLR